MSALPPQTIAREQDDALEPMASLINDTTGSTWQLPDARAVEDAVVHASSLHVHLPAQALEGPEESHMPGAADTDQDGSILPVVRRLSSRTPSNEHEHAGHASDEASRSQDLERVYLLCCIMFSS